ncbi:hypothetical protein IAD21_06089 [Abditibacteriota bacterium]|nr:hypothetical protein IAD21_06089 [Abditibacteriota bacterium]
MTRTPWGTSRSVWSESNAPLTLALIIITSLVCLLSFFGAPQVANALSFSPPGDWRQPWRLLTYPLSTFEPLGMLFYGVMLWWVGGSLERSWGTRFYAGFFASMTVITALGMTLGSLLLHVPAAVGYYLPMSALFFAWCCINPEQEVRIWGIFPVLAKWLAVGEVLIIFFSNARPSPFMGIFALMGCGAAFAWVKNRAWADVNLYQTTPSRWDSNPAPRRPRLRIVPPKSSKPKDDRFTIRDLNPFEWFAKRRRRKQFEKLMRDD